MRLFRRLYSTWCFGWFLLLFLILFPLFVLLGLRDSWKPYSFYLNWIWGRIAYFMCGIRIDIRYQTPLDIRQPYVFVSNHTSYADIPSFGYLMKQYFMFVGKSSIAKAPLFGFMFKQHHIPVTRENPRSGMRSLQKASEALRKGTCIVIYPEGGIRTKHPPRLAPFKDGAFRLAIENQVPIVPVTLPYNYRILPDDGKYLFFRHSMKAIIHTPIPTQGMNLTQVEELRDRTYRLIEEELARHHPQAFARPIGS